MMTAEEAVAASLTPREREALGWMARGCDDVNVAVYMGLSRNTVRTYAQNIHGKLGTHNRIEMVRRGYELGVIG